MTYHNYRTFDYTNKKPDSDSNQREGQKLQHFPAFIYTLFYIFSAYLALPIVDVPLLGLSISAPIMFIIAVPVFFKPPKPWFKQYQLWIFLAMAIFTGIFLSTILNGITSFGMDFDTSGAIFLIRYLYWLIVFVITVYFASQWQVLKKLTAVLGWGVLILALLRWGEVVLFGNYIGVKGTRFLSQNNYGFLFSTFSPFLLVMIFQERGSKRLIAVIGNLLLWGAAAVNGSRGSWLSIAIGLAFIFLLFFIQNKRKFSGLIVFILFSGSLLGILWFSIPQISSAIQQRFETFQYLDQDKSALIRELMVQKGVRLFKESPIIGVGADRFKQESIVLDIPKQLAYASSEHFEVKSAHNSYIQFLAEFGLLGAVPFGILLLTNGFQGSKITLDELKQDNLVPLAVLLSFLQMSAHMWVISSITNSLNWFIYGLVGAMIMAYKMR